MLTFSPTHATSDAVMQANRTIDKGSYLQCTCSGAVDLEGLVAVLKHIHDECLANRKEGVILDLTSTTGTLSGLERFTVAMRVVPTWDRSIRVAVALHPDQAAPGAVGQLFAQNRGRRARVFTSLSAATAWMEASFAPPTDDPS